MSSNNFVLGDNSKLFCLEEVCCRSEISRFRFTSSAGMIEKAQDLRALYQSNDEDDQIEDYLSSLAGPVRGLAEVIMTDDQNVMEELRTNGYCLFLAEEVYHFIGLTKELVGFAYLKVWEEDGTCEGSWDDVE